MPLHDGNHFGHSTRVDNPLADGPERFRETRRLVPCGNDDGKGGVVLIHVGRHDNWLG